MGHFDDKGNLRAVLLKFHQNYIPYAADDNFDHEGLASVMAKDSELRKLNGLKKIISLLIPWIKQKIIKSQELYYTKCNQLQEMETGWQVKVAGIQDIERIMALYKHISSFEINPLPEKSIWKRESPVRIILKWTGKWFRLLQRPRKIQCLP